MEPQRAAAPGGEGPQLASAGPLVQALRKLQPDIVIQNVRPNGRSGPQPPPGGGPQFVPELACAPQAAPRE